jgi:hypothetical protein
MPQAICCRHLLLSTAVAISCSCAAFAAFEGLYCLPYPPFILPRRSLTPQALSRSGPVSAYTRLRTVSLGQQAAVTRQQRRQPTGAGQQPTGAGQQPTGAGQQSTGSRQRMGAGQQCLSSFWAPGQRAGKSVRGVGVGGYLVAVLGGPVGLRRRLVRSPACTPRLTSPTAAAVHCGAAAPPHRCGGAALSGQRRRSSAPHPEPTGGAGAGEGAGTRAAWGTAESRRGVTPCTCHRRRRRREGGGGGRAGRRTWGQAALRRGIAKRRCPSPPPPRHAAGPRHRLSRVPPPYSSLTRFAGTFPHAARRLHEKGRVTSQSRAAVTSPCTPSYRRQPGGRWAYQGRHRRRAHMGAAAVSEHTSGDAHRRSAPRR